MLLSPSSNLQSNGFFFWDLVPSAAGVHFADFQVGVAGVRMLVTGTVQQHHRVLRCSRAAKQVRRTDEKYVMWQNYCTFFRALFYLIPFNFQDLL